MAGRDHGHHRQHRGAPFDGIDGIVVSTQQRVNNPTIYSEEIWFKTTTTTGGKLIGFGNDSRPVLSSSYDRHVYMQNDGQLVFGVWTVRRTPSPRRPRYNDGQWHHVVATQGPPTA